jgi:hypothetical protein
LALVKVGARLQTAMTIDDGIGPTWTRALQPDGRDLKFCTTEELTSMGAIERVSRWHGVSLGEARDRIQDELASRNNGG